MEAIANPWGALIVFLLVTGLILSLLLTRGRGLKISREGVQAGHCDDAPLIPRKYARDIIAIVARSVEHNEKLHDIKKQCLSQQMRHFEELETSILGIYKRAFRDLVIMKNLGPVESNEELAHFSDCTRSIMRDVKDACRSYFLNNHYAEMSQAEWNEYIALKKISVPHMVYEESGLHWVSSRIPLSDMHDFLERECATQMLSILENLFTKAKTIACETYERMQEENASYAACTMRTAGWNPYEDETGGKQNGIR